MPIRVLPTLLVNQIAAGEVIERPASVVKELVDNSLDAGAGRIDVTVEDGGRQLIRVSDDGSGIPEEELSLALEPHATSKLRHPDELASIGTMGFRGEALASIASVSRLRLTSRATVDGAVRESGASIESAGGETGLVTPTACSPGSVVEVRELFFNTPARRKFLRAGPTEVGHISDVLQRIAIAHPHVAFSLSHNGRVTFEFAPTDSPRLRCVDVLGKEVDEALLEFESRQPWGGVWGLAGLPSIGRATAKFQYLCINGRPIRDRNLAHAIREAYRGLLAPDLQPVVVVFIRVDPHAVDVNVHPAKTEVRLREPGQLHGLVLSAIRQRLLGSDLTPSVALNGKSWRPPVGAEDPSAPAPAPVTAHDFVEYFKRMDPTQKGFVYQQVREQMNDAPLLERVGDGQPGNGFSGPPAPVTAAVTNQVLQVHQSYVVTQDDEGLVIIDQHALHERVMFEQLRKRILSEGKPLESQRLLVPEVLHLNPARMALLDDLAALLERIGIEVSVIGPGAVGVQAFPTFLFDRHVEPGEFIEGLLDKAQEGAFDVKQAANDESALHEVLDMMACKAAVKAGDKLSGEELSALLTQREEVERSASCPHGRPTTIRLTLRDLEKHFKRS
ncbi:MAG: DNA mismatch repair endonuclease MutL [Phycisphaera sp.]|nr:DNA mismatch repair endonuclease MutL [Phycisphaera sp.]